MLNFISLLGVLLSSSGLMASQCDNPLMKDELCFKMRHLRSQVMALGAQRELMQVNYPYLTILGKEVLFLANSIPPASVTELGHPEGLDGLKIGSQSLIDLASQQDPLALAAANTLQKKCASCHNQTGPSGGHSWDKIFKHDWEQVTKNCAREGRVPYLCKSMNGLLSAFATVLTGPNADRKDFEGLRLSALEISRIAGDLKAKNMLHGSEESMNAVEAKANLTAQQASESNDQAFETAREITTGCMECHASRAMSPSGQSLKLKQLL
jgi:cytochrome c553